MKITVELLKEKGACINGIKWFEEHFPNGTELDYEVIAKAQGCPTNFVWWFYNNVQQDRRLYTLCGVNMSDGVNRSNGVNRSDGVNWSNGVKGSDGVNRSYGVNMSDGVNRSYGINNSFGVVNCHGLSNAMFAIDMAQAPILFGKSISKERMAEVKDQFYNKLNGWRPCYYRGKKESTNKEAWEGMPQEAIDYLRSLDEFDADIFERITGIKTEER